MLSYIYELRCKTFCGVLKFDVWSDCFVTYRSVQFAQDMVHSDNTFRHIFICSNGMITE